MLNAGESGFVNAPVTKTVVCVVVVLTLFGSILGSQTRLVLSIPALARGQLWRLLTTHLVFSTPGELLFGVVLLYFFRQFERQMGSARYAALAAFTAALHSGALVAAHLLLPSWPPPASGPYALVYAALVRFALETPPLYTFKVAGPLAFSDKAFPYLLALQLALSAPARSWLPVCSAMLAGLLARAPPLAARLTTPQPIVDACSATLLPLLGTMPPRTRALRRRRAAPAAGGSGATNGAPVNTAEAQRAVSGANIDTLIAMGFSRQDAIDALLRANDDVQLATEQLLAAAH